MKTCFLQAVVIEEDTKPSTSNHTGNNCVQKTPDLDGLTIQSAKPVILVHSPSQETSDDTTTSSGHQKPKIIPTGSATPVFCRVQPQNPESKPSVVVTRQRPPPPPRKPCCTINSFPSLPEELLVGIGATVPQSSDPNGPGITDV